MPGAAVIHYELHAVGDTEISAVRTIHRWVVEKDWVPANVAETEERESKVIPLPQAAQVNRVQQLDLALHKLAG